QRQLVIYIPQQNDALLGNMLSILEPPEYVDHFLHRWVVDNPDRKHRSQYAMHHVIEPRRPHFAALHSFLEGIAKERTARHLLVQSACGCFGCAMCSAPIRHHPSLESKSLLQPLVQKVIVPPVPIPVSLVVRPHPPYRL